MKTLTGKKVYKLWDYIEKMKESAEINKKNVIRKDTKSYYEGIIRAFDYTLSKIDWLLKN